MPRVRPSGFDLPTPIEAGRAYTVVVFARRREGSPVVAAGVEDGPIGPGITTVNAWSESRVSFQATTDGQVVGVERLDDSTGPTDVVVMVVPISDVDHPYAGGYFDGRYGGGKWTGPEFASTSTFVDTRLRITSLIDAYPGPRVRVESDALAPGTEYVTLRRMTADDDVAVPGAERVPALAGFILTDYYPPFRTPILYRAEMFDADGDSLGYTETGPAYVDEDRTWLSSPTDPNRALPIELAASAGSALADEFVGQVHRIGTRRVLITALGTGLVDLDMSFYTDTIAEYQQALAIFRQNSGAVVIRTPPPMQVPRVLYFWSPKPTRMEWNLPAGIEWFDWQNVGTEISAPTSKVIAAVLSYRRYVEAYPSYRAFADANLTYRMARLNPPIDA